MVNWNERLVHQREPYHYQRDRQLGNKQPRPPQPAYQPNQLPPLQGWGGDTFSYWNEVFDTYLKRRNAQSKTLKFGGI